MDITAEGGTALAAEEVEEVCPIIEQFLGGRRIARAEAPWNGFTKDRFTKDIQRELPMTEV